jgi:site-specific recombinase XerD
MVLAEAANQGWRLNFVSDALADGRRFRAVQPLLGHAKIESTVRYLGVEVDDALAIAEQVDV